MVRNVITGKANADIIKAPAVSGLNCYRYNVEMACIVGNISDYTGKAYTIRNPDVANNFPHPEII